MKWYICTIEYKDIKFVDCKFEMATTDLALQRMNQLIKIFCVTPDVYNYNINLYEINWINGA